MPNATAMPTQDVSSGTLRILRVLVQIWDIVCEPTAPRIERIERVEFHEAGVHKNYQALAKEGVPFFRRHLAPRKTDSRPKLPSLYRVGGEADLLLRGARQWNTCVISCAALYQVVQDLFAGGDEVYGVDWIYTIPNPKYVIFDPESTRRDVAHYHDVLELHTRNGALILDCSGAQFGFMEAICPKQEYEKY